MSLRASIRRVDSLEAKLQREGIEVFNLCGKSYRLGQMNGGSERISKCYASGLGNCIGPLSNEHYISDSILNQLGEMKKDAFPWLKFKSGETVVPNDLRAKILCRYHNSFLAPLDHLAGKIFGSFTSGKEDKSALLVWGPSLERWCLKVLLGFISAKRVFVNEKLETAAEIPFALIEILFGIREFPKDTGLFILPFEGQQLAFGKKLTITTLVLEGKTQGIRIGLAGMDYWLSLAPSDRAFNKKHPAFKNVIRRPAGMEFEGNPNRLKIYWD